MVTAQLRGQSLGEESVQSLAARAERFEEQGKWEEAIGKYRDALRIKPNYPLASANLEHALSQAGTARTR